MKIVTTMVVFVVMIFISLKSFSQQSAVFQIKYKLPTISSPFGICESADNGILITGVFVDSSNSSVAFVLKTNFEGDIEWIKKYSSDQGIIHTRDIQLTSDSGFVLIGWIEFSNFDADGFLLKADQEGNILWAKQIGDSTSAIYFRGKQTSDLGFILSGERGDGGTKAYIAKTDSVGNLLWSKVYGFGQNKDVGDDVIEDANGDFVMAGRGTTGTIPDGYLIKTDQNGNAIWKKTYGDQGYNSDEFYSLALTSDGGYIMTGYSNIYNVTPQHTSLVKTDSGGNLLWTKVFQIGYFSEGYYVTETSDKGFVILGAKSDTTNLGQFFMIKTDSAGILEWQREYGTDLNEDLSDGFATHDGGYLLTGSSSYSSATDIYVIKTDSSGFSGCEEIEPSVNEIFQKVIVGSYGDESSYGTSTTVNCAITDLNIIDSAYCVIVDGIEPNYFYPNSIDIFPNPVQNLLTINLLSPSAPASVGTTVVYDVAGKKIVLPTTYSNNKAELTTTTLPNGIYLLQIINNKTGMSEVGKFVKE
ncbi:MAG TPA: T9SS type A sorting domain-containing protein [Chitinophagales bacterium]|nr:T9SS type A sorting domain-containing protein [Chitinophagales bacterium]